MKKDLPPSPPLGLTLPWRAQASCSQRTRTQSRTQCHTHARTGALALLLAALCALAPAHAAELAPTDPTLDPALATQVRELLGSRIAPTPAGATAPRITVDIGRLDPRLRLSPCRRVQPQLLPATQGRPWGRSRVSLECVEGERRWKVWLPVTVHVFAPALVPARPLPAGTVLSAQDLRLAEVDWAAQTQAPQVQAAALVGRTLARALGAGEAIRDADLRRRQWFDAGETVQVLARGAGFTVSGQAQALSAGVEGQVVRLRTEAGRVLSGRAIGQRQVEIVL